MKRIVNCGLGVVLAGLAGITNAQTQSSSNAQNSTAGQSLGEYARQIRKPADNGKPKVFDNDNMPKSDKLSVVGNAAPASSEEPKPDEMMNAGQAKASTEGQQPPKPDAAAKSGETTAPEVPKETAWKQWGDKINAQKQQIDMLTREVTVLQREYQLRAAAMYADAGNRLRNQADWDKQDAQYKQQIADKQKAVDEAKTKLEDLQEQARRAGVPDSFLEPASTSGGQ